VEISIESAPGGEAELVLRSAGGNWQLNGEAITTSAESGYLRLRRNWKAGDRLTVELPLPIQRVRAHPQVASAAGRLALQRGPVVYAVEQADHGEGLTSLGLNREAELSAQWEPNAWGGVTTITGEAMRETSPDTLYSPVGSIARETVPLRAIPYAWWGNRGEGEMRIWIRDYES
jgi:DUF1680 family protein